MATKVVMHNKGAMMKVMKWMWEEEATIIDEKGKPVKTTILTEFPIDGAKKVRVAHYKHSTPKNKK